jgi:hypothetical protein
VTEAQPPATGDTLSTVRRLWWALLTGGLFIGFVLFLISDIDLGFEAVWSALIIGFGVVGQVARRRLENDQLKALPPEPDEAVADWWRSRFFLGFALTEAALLMGFVLCFMVGAIWPYLAALPVYLYGMLAIRPTDAHLALTQQQITAAGSPVILENALRSKPQAS